MHVLFSRIISTCLPYFYHFQMINLIARSKMLTLCYRAGVPNSKVSVGRSHGIENKIYFLKLAYHPSLLWHLPLDWRTGKLCKLSHATVYPPFSPLAPRSRHRLGKGGPVGRSFGLGHFKSSSQTEKSVGIPAIEELQPSTAARLQRHANLRSIFKHTDSKWWCLIT